MKTIIAMALSAASGLCLSASAFAQSATDIPGVVKAGVTPELVSEIFLNTEGPLGMPDGSLIFSDTNASITYRLDGAGKIWTERFGTNRGNGIALTRRGEMIWAEEPRITARDSNGGFRNLVAGTRLFQPNDLIADDRGGIYFTDPGPRPVVKGLKVNVYYLPPGTTKPIVVDDSVPRPNGVILSIDGRTLYVANTIGDTVFAYNVQADGKLTNRRNFAKLRDIPAGQEGFGDGMAIDRDDRLYVTTLVGVQIFDVKGAYLGNIKVPRQPSNVAFAGADQRILYITARQGIYRIALQSQGPARFGK